MFVNKCKVPAIGDSTKMIKTLHLMDSHHIHALPTQMNYKHEHKLIIAKQSGRSKKNISIQLSTFEDKLFTTHSLKLAPVRERCDVRAWR